MSNEELGEQPDVIPPEPPPEGSKSKPIKRFNGKAPESLRNLWMQWGLALAQNGNGLLANVSNASAVLESDPTLQGLVWHDSFLNRYLTGDPPREWREQDDIALTVYLQREIGLTRIGRELVAQAVVQIAEHNKKNCVCDWLDTLAHDGTPRIEHFFIDNFGAADSEYMRAASRNFWISLVARAYSPGCKVDNMIVLEGPQGAGKSSALKIIGGDHFTEQHESATNPKAFSEILQGKLIVEISEMDSFNRAEVNRVKQAISCSSDRFRPSYGHYAIDHPRTCIFVGTTNRDDWNRDETGARRFWPIACVGTINQSGISENRDQLFAEAVKLHKAGSSYWEMPPDATKAEQDARFQADPWLDQVEEIVKGESFITTAHILGKLDRPIGQQTRGDEMRVAGCLRHLRWIRGQKRIDGKPRRGYHKPGSEVDTPAKVVTGGDEKPL